MSQLERYNKGGIGRWYWDYRDREILRLLPSEDRILWEKRVAFCQGKSKESPKILDTGCGDMITTRKISGAIGMDLDRGDVLGSVYNIPFPENSFDYVLLLEVIEHLKDPVAAIKEIRRVLKPGGRVIILFPNDLIFKAAWFLTGKLGEIFRDRGHVCQWNPVALHMILIWYGFKVISHKSIPFRLWPISLHHIVVAEKC